MYAQSINSDDEQLFLNHPGDMGAPLLKPSMRKLRHVQGIALRNLMLNGPDTAKRRTSWVNWKRRGSIDGEQADRPTELQQPNGGGATDSPRRTRRRRTTITQPGQAMGVEMEQTLQDLNQMQLLDSMYALYSQQQTVPVYISEMAHRSMNPEFIDMDFSNTYCRNDSHLGLSVWVKSIFDSQWKHLFMIDFELSGLEFVGRSMDIVQATFPPNSFIVQLEDGCYILPRSGLITQKPTQMPTPSLDVPTLNFSMIMKLNNLEDCIDDADRTVKYVGKQLEELMAVDNVFLMKKRQQQLANKLKHTRANIDLEKSKAAKLLKQAEQSRARIASRRKVMQEQLVKKQEIKSSMTNGRSLEKEVDVQMQCMAIERSRIAGQLQVIFPIQPVLHKKFEFSICDLTLTDNSKTVESGADDEVGAAYGFASQLVFLLSKYLSVPLRYPIQPYGSNSYIIDPVSTIQGSRTFPLWTKGTLYYRFDYGVYLFRKDMEQLINFQHLDVVDISHTLANLKNLLLVLSSPKKSM